MAGWCGHIVRLLMRARRQVASKFGKDTSLCVCLQRFHLSRSESWPALRRDGLLSPGRCAAPKLHRRCHIKMYRSQKIYDYPKADCKVSIRLSDGDTHGGKIVSWDVDSGTGKLNVCGRSWFVERQSQTRCLASRLTARKAQRVAGYGYGVATSGVDLELAPGALCGNS